MNTRRQRGFTAIEVLVVCAIVGILAAIALPSYINSVQKGRRSDAKSALVGAAGQLERYFTERGTYATATLGSSGVAPSTSLNGFYNLSFASQTATTYALSAAPAGAQVGDPCGNFTYDYQGVKGVNGGTKTVADCW
ncbi:MAG TPA: type IV pilin protein [Casimicrobiaceae bacterium]|nr:type IV pilin protein [Casimicrobiaceae bacterium]